MATINWPIPTVVGQIYTSTNGDAWKWTGDYWQSIGTSSIGGTGATNQVTLWSGTNALTGTNAIAYTNTPGSNVNITISDSGFGSVLGRGIVDTSVSNGSATNTIRSGSNNVNINPIIEFKRAKNSLVTPNTLTVGTYIGETKHTGAYDALGNYRTSAIIRTEATELWSATASGTKLSINTISNGTTTPIERISIEGTGFIKFYNLYTFPSTIGTNGQVLATNGAGPLSWMTITAAMINAPTGTGTPNYLARWTPGSTTLGTSIIQDNGTTTSIGNTLDPSHRLLVMASTSITGDAIAGFNTSTISGNQIGINGQSYGAGNGTNIGVLAAAAANITLNIGVRGAANGVSIKNIGGEFTASGATSNYAIKLVDGTQAADRFLKSVNSSGEANWANITTADVAGSLSGTGVNNRITLWTGTSTVSSSPNIIWSDSGDATITLKGTSNTLVLGGTGSGLTSNPPAQFGLTTVNNSNIQYSIFTLKHARGTTAAQTPVLNGDILGDYRFDGGAGTGAYIRAQATIAHVSPSTLGSDLQFGTINNSNINAIRLRITNTGAIKFNEVYTFPTTDGTSNQVLKTDGVGNLSWTNSGTVNGTGTPNYLARWTGSGTTLTNGITQDNGVGVSIGPTAIINTQKLRVVGDSTNVNVTEFIHLNALGGDNRSFLFNMEGSVGSSYNHGIVSRASSVISTPSGHLSYGVLGIAGSTSQSGSTTGGYSVGVKGVGFMKAQSTNNTNGAIGVQGMAFGGTAGATSYGVYAYGHTDNYNLGFALSDPNKGIGKFIKCVDSNGGATWATITAADITGLSSLTGGGAANKMAFWTNGTNLSYDNGIQVTSTGSDRGIIATGGSSTLESSSNIIRIQAIAGATAANAFLFLGSTGPGSSASFTFGDQSTVINSGKTLGNIYWSGGGSSSARISVQAGASFTTALAQSEMSFYNTLLGGVVQTERIRLTSGEYNSFSGATAPGALALTNDTQLLIGGSGVPTPTFASYLPTAKARYHVEISNSTFYQNGLIASVQNQQSSESIGVYGESLGTGFASPGTKIGVRGSAAQGTGINIGVEGYIPSSYGISIGGHFQVPIGATTGYSLWLEDGTQGIGKVLTSKTADGKAQWAEITPEITKNKIIRLYGTSGLGTGLTASTATGKSPIGSGPSLDALTKTATMPISLAVGWVGTSVYDFATGIFTAPTSGWYEISYNVSLQPIAGGWASTSQITAMVIAADFPTNYYMTSRGVAGSYTPFHLTTSCYQKSFLTAGTTLKFRILLNGTQNYTSNGNDILEWNIAFLGN